MSSIMHKMNLSLKSGRDMDANGMILLAVGLLIVVAPLDLGQLAFAFVGALCYAALQASRKVTRNTLLPSEKIRRNKLDDADSKSNYHAKSPIRKATTSAPPKREANPAGRQEFRQASTMPVAAPSFNADKFDTQVQELLGQIAPTAEGDKLVQDIAAAVKHGLSKFIPEAEVMGFASGDVLRGTAFAVAIPEIDIILSASPSVFVERLKCRAARPLPHAAKLDPRKLQKSILRACTDELTAIPGFKFRRSAFKGLEPKVTLMAEVNGRTVPIDFSVNTITPLHNAALLTECGQIDMRAKELILLVRRWAKDRGISHAAKGHLSPYCWSLLVIYFLQVWDGQENPILPNINSFKMSSALLRKQQKDQQSDRAGRIAAKSTSVADLFKEFVRFYVETFNWRNESVSVRAGKRQPPATSLPLHIVTLENGSTAVTISVEDPFEPTRNLSDAMSGVTLRRLREEMTRAKSLSSQEASLAELLEPWVPPEREAAAEVDEQEE
jgi:DNA polymerase sigma